MTFKTGLFNRTSWVIPNEIKYNKETNTKMNNTKYKIKTEMRNGNRIAVIAPEQAEKIFSERLPNRPFNMNRAKLYAKAMLDGSWKPCSQISFCNGKLDDGQHRIMASVLSGKPFEGTIYHHDDPETFAVFDIGAKRQNSDILAIEGNKNCTSLAATLQLLERVNSPTGLPNAVGGGARKKVETYDIVKTLTKYPGIQNSVNLVNSYVKYFRIPLASSAALHYYLTLAIQESMFASRDADLANIFVVNKLFKGLELAERDPVYSFRNYLSKIKASSDVRGSLRITHNLLLMGGIQTWNRWVQGKTLRSFKLSETNFMPKILLP